MISSSTKKWRLFRSWAGGHPMWCAWQVTYRCNFRCRFCNYWASPNRPDDEPTVRDYELGATKLARMGTLLVSLAGGEPLLRTDVPEIVSAVGRWHFPFLTTNGWLATRELARDIMKAGLWGVSISIDYADPKKHDQRRGMPGAWEHAWRAVELFSAARVWEWQRVNVIAVLMEDNLDEIEPLIRLCAKHRAYFMVQPYGQLKTGSPAFAHRNGPVSPRLLELRRQYPNFLSNASYLGRFDQFHNGGVPGCRAGHAFFNIDEKGDVSICVENRHHSVANLYRDSMWVIHRRLHEAAEGNACRKCWYNCRGETECLYDPVGVVRSLPTLFFDRGAASVGRGVHGLH
jgi:MoaA/NifB/PqqE/SkfB family radical SAM enzyme